MGKTYSRVQRGQVYWFDPIKAYGGYDTFIGFNGREYKSSIQLNNRPWLVVSNNEGNFSSPTCNIVPITLEDKTDIPVHVHFNYEGKRQTILVEQVRTVDCLALTDYIYTVSDELMEKVEKAMAVQYSIRPTVTYADFTLDSTIKHLEVVIANIISNKVELIKQELQKEQLPAGVIPTSQVEDAALHLGQMIEDLVGEEIKPMVKQQPKQQETPKAETPKPIPKPEPVKPTEQPKKKPNYSGMSAIEKFNARYNKTQDTEPKAETPKQPEPTKTKTSSGKRNTWTNEARMQYLKDCEEMAPREVQEKYGFKAMQSVFQMKYLHKNALIKAGLLKVED